MFAVLRSLVVGLVFLAGGVTADGDPPSITPKAEWIKAQLDQMDVESKWPAGVHIDWRTGLPDGEPESLVGKHTHCSAFVAAAAERLGVYILRPPEHPQLLLANAQNEWLQSDGAAQGWRRLADASAAQDAANLGFLVVASYHNRNDAKPGHIAIVLPGAKSLSALALEGPDVMQAATTNSARISLRDGFAGHRGAFEGERILFFAHAVDAP